MSRIVRWMLALTLAVALPAQGVVAATMGVCGPKAPVAMADHAGHGHDGAQAHHGGHDHEAPAKAETHRCAACAVCAAAHGLPPSPAAFEPALRAEAHPDADVPGVEPFVSEPLERPPRSDLARA